MQKIEMDVTITVTGEVDCKEMQEDLKEYGATVTQLPDGAKVEVRVDIINDAIEHIMTVCHKYGDHEVKAKRVGL